MRSSLSRSARECANNGLDRAIYPHPHKKCTLLHPEQITGLLHIISNRRVHICHKRLVTYMYIVLGRVFHKRLFSAFLYRMCPNNAQTTLKRNTAQSEPFIIVTGIFQKVFCAQPYSKPPSFSMFTEQTRKLKP